MQPRKSISITESTYNNLSDFCKKRESFDKAINRLLEKAGSNKPRQLDSAPTDSSRPQKEYKCTKCGKKFKEDEVIYNYDGKNYHIDCSPVKPQKDKTPEDCEHFDERSKTCAKDRKTCQYFGNRGECKK